MKETYETLKMNVVVFETEDVITASREEEVYDPTAGKTTN